MKRVTMLAVFVLSAALAGCAADVPPEPSESTGETTQATRICDWVYRCTATGELFEAFGPPQTAQGACIAHCAGSHCVLASVTECDTI